MDLLLAAGQEEEALHEQQIQDLRKWTRPLLYIHAAPCMIAEQQHARKVEKMEEKGRRMIKELEEARLQLKTYVDTFCIGVINTLPVQITNV